MNNLLAHQAFIAYAIACLILCGNLLFLWACSGAVRGKTKTTPNLEDVATFGGSMADVDPPAVARLLHSFAYLKQWQPWRTVFCVIGAMATGVFMVNVAWLLTRTA